jgi:hypothetical protein
MARRLLFWLSASAVVLALLLFLTFSGFRLASQARENASASTPHRLPASS